MPDIHKPIDPQQTFPQMEEQVLERWRRLGVFEQSLKQREGATPWVFYEGPPTANGRPGAHHVLSRVFKDIFPRYKTMRGHYVQRKGGWDCHGLPVELGVEAELGLKSKQEIEQYGIAEFNAKCRDSVFTYLDEWNRLTERIGFWVDLDDAYRTLDNDFVESVWWALKEIWAKGLLYEGNRVVPYCPRCGTALSSHEVAQGYEDVVDQSIYVKFEVTEGNDLAEAGDQLLVWTTTPWTLPSNVAVAASAELTYARVEYQGQVYLLAEGLVEAVIGEDAKTLNTLSGKQLAGIKYRPPFDYIDAASGISSDLTYTVNTGDFVTATDGTGLVHIAPPFGEDDYSFAMQSEIISGAADVEFLNPVKLDGTYDQRVAPHAGRFVKEVDADLIAELDAAGKVFKTRAYEHSYPHCWRCGTPLLYYAKPSWYIATTKVRQQMLAANETVEWHPQHIKQGRFGNWLENNIDWAISRERYWGTPLPIWRCEDGHIHCVGSFAELQELSGVEIDDPHRPYVDTPTFDCADCGKPMQRVPEVLDVWFDSGAMPFAQLHAPHENNEQFQASFPADFICEALDQTRGWFYSLLAVSTLLFDQAPYKNVVCLGLILDPEGQKMSKTRGNVVVPWEVIDQHGADAFRWYYFTSKQPWDGYRFSVETVGESVRQFLLQLWNTYGFYVLYANVNGVEPQAIGDVELTELDRWAISRLASTTAEVTERLDDYDATFAGRAIAQLVDDLSNWYVRRSRRRFWDGDPAACATLHHCLVTISQLLAPFTPFVADEIYVNLVPDGLDSVHLCDFPQADAVGEIDTQLEFAMATARETVRLGLAARGQAKMKVRQPLAKAVVVAAGREREAIERLAEIVREELNVKAIEFVDDADQLGSYEIKPNYRTLGPRFGKEMPAVAAAVAALDPAAAVAATNANQPVVITVNAVDEQLQADDLLMQMQPIGGYQLEREGSHAVALDLALSDELRSEGLAREVVHAVQAARKDEGFNIEDRIQITIKTASEQLLATVNDFGSYIAAEVLAPAGITAELDTQLPDTAATIDGHPLRMTLSKVS